MPGHTQVETLFRQLDLVPRMGERRESELCVMSLVALLAGERHSDRPATACPVIAAYAIKVNDTVDCDTRQGLKLMATRIMGTNDGRLIALDAESGELCLDFGQQGEVRIDPGMELWWPGEFQFTSPPVVGLT